MLTKTEMKHLNALLEKEDIKGKKWLNDFIWRNNVQPKFKIGDAVKVTDRGLSICDERVINWNGRVAEIKYWGSDHHISYRVEVEYTNRGILKTTDVYANEDTLVRSKTDKSGKVFNSDSKYEEASFIYFGKI